MNRAPEHPSKRAMLTTIDTGDACEALDFHPHGPEDAPPICEPEMPNVCSMGVVTLDSDGTFISSRLLNAAELAQAWDDHAKRTA